jgi:hypothetical protein
MDLSQGVPQRGLHEPFDGAAAVIATPRSIFRIGATLRDMRLLPPAVALAAPHLQRLISRPWSTCSMAPGRDLSRVVEAAALRAEKPPHAPRQLSAPPTTPQQPRPPGFVRSEGPALSRVRRTGSVDERIFVHTLATAGD